MALTVRKCENFDPFLDTQKKSHDESQMHFSGLFTSLLYRNPTIFDKAAANSKEELGILELDENDFFLV